MLTNGAVQDASAPRAAQAPTAPERVGGRPREPLDPHEAYYEIRRAGRVMRALYTEFEDLDGLAAEDAAEDLARHALQYHEALLRTHRRVLGGQRLLEDGLLRAETYLLAIYVLAAIECRWLDGGPTDVRPSNPREFMHALSFFCHRLLEEFPGDGPPEAWLAEHEEAERKWREREAPAAAGAGRGRMRG